MEPSYKFFSNTYCKYFPCHENISEDAFNCLFCYCPLYSLKADCGGIYKYNKSGTIKICMDCHLPHRPDYYDVVIEKLKDAIPIKNTPNS